MTVSRTICLGFLAIITLGTLLLMLPISTYNGTWNEPVTALFTATSAVSVTGLSVVDVGRFYSFWGQVAIALLVQVGGLGYMSATTFLLLVLGRQFGLKDKLALQQSLDMPGLAGVVQLVRSIVITTAIVELVGMVLLFPVFWPEYGFKYGTYLAWFLSISAFNNAGISLFYDNLISYATSPLLNFVIAALIISGGIGYQVIRELYLWVRDRLAKNPERFVFSLHFKVVTSTTIFLLLFGTIALLVAEFDNPSTLGSFNLGHKILAAWFQSVAARSGGFNTIDTGQLRPAPLLITIVLMFIGASPGGTGSGIKTTTLRVLLSCTLATLQGRKEVLCYQRQIPTGLMMKAVSVLVGSLLVVIVSTTLIALTDPQMLFIKVLFEVVSAFGTVGLSTGITSQISTFGQLVLIATMYIGRVGVLLLMNALLGSPSPSAIQYPEENLLVG